MIIVSSIIDNFKLYVLSNQNSFQYIRFGEALRAVQDDLDAKNFYYCNPSFDSCCGKAAMQRMRRMR